MLLGLLAFVLRGISLLEGVQLLDGEVQRTSLTLPSVLFVRLKNRKVGFLGEFAGLQERLGLGGESGEPLGVRGVVEEVILLPECETGDALNRGVTNLFP